MNHKNPRIRMSFRRVALSTAMVAGIVLGQMGAAISPAYGQSAAVRQGYSLLSEGRVDDAIATFQRQLQRDPNDLEALLGLGIAYRRAGRDADAFATYQRVLALDPNNQLALSTIGLLGEFRPEWQPIGIEALTRLLEQDPDLIDARAQRAKLFYYQGLYSQALADYAIVLPRTSDPEILGPAAEAHTFSGDYPTGLVLFDRYRAAGGKSVAIAPLPMPRPCGKVAKLIRPFSC